MSVLDDLDFGATIELIMNRLGLPEKQKLYISIVPLYSEIFSPYLGQHYRYPIKEMKLKQGNKYL